MSDDGMKAAIFEPEESYHIEGYHYMVVAAPAAQPLWMIKVERGSWQGALLVAIFALFFSETPVTVRVVRFRRRVGSRWETVCSSDFPSVEAANRAARDWDRQLAAGTLPSAE